MTCRSSIIWPMCIIIIEPPSPDHSVTGLRFAKIVCIIAGEYEQGGVHKRYNVVGNGPDTVVETSGAVFSILCTAAGDSHVRQNILFYLLLYIM